MGKAVVVGENTNHGQHSRYCWMLQRISIKIGWPLEKISYLDKGDHS